MPRQGPGSDEQTRRALEFITIPDGAPIADMGCGTGTQTLALARHTSGNIHALDLLPAMIDGLNERIAKNGLRKRVTTYVGSMDNPPFQGRKFDLIWAEGSIYNIGFENGFRQWRELLLPGGYIAVTETCWLTHRRPEDTGYIDANFPEIDTISGKLRVIEEAGYEPVAHFILPSECWTDEYFEPAEARLEEFLRERGDDPRVVEFARYMRDEIDHYHRNGTTFGYVFFIARRVG